MLLKIPEMLMGAFLLVHGHAHQFTSVPFWKAKPKVYQKIKDERYIAVSVRADQAPSGSEFSKVLRFHGGLHVRGVAAANFARLTKFNELVSVSPYIRSVEWNADKMQLLLRGEAFSFRAHMLMKIRLVERKEVRDIEFEVIDGAFKEMKGVVRLEGLEKQVTEMSIQAEMGYNTLLFPAFFVEFGFEVVLQRLAAAVRAWLEKSA